MGLAGEHLTLCLTVSTSKLLALPLDPLQALHNGETDRVLAETMRSSDAYASERGIHGNVQILDVFEDNVYPNSRDGEVGASCIHRGP